MDSKVNMAIPTLFLILGMLLAIPPATSAGIPNLDHIYWVSFGGPESVDPAWAYDTASGEVIQNVYEPLCQFDGMSTEAFIACLADDWPGYGTPGNFMIPSAPDAGAPAGTTETWYFHIRENVKWHDWNSSGLYLRPSDVEYSIERGMLQDHTGGPQWMMFEPLLGSYSAYDFDYNHNDVIDNDAEYVDLYGNVTAAVESNITHVWFNLPAPYAPFQQVLCHSCAMIIQEEWAIAHGCWGATKDYADFAAHFDPPEPGPLDDPSPETCGTGPYTIAAANWDPNTGWITYHKNYDYWKGWVGNHVTYATMKLVNEWANRKAQFFSTDPNMQADLCTVPRPNVPEMHVGGDKDGPNYPGFRMQFVFVPSVSGTYFNYDIDPSGAYIPKIGPTDTYDFFSDRYVRLGFLYAFNFTTFNIDYWLGEAYHPTTCMPAGTAFYNDTFPLRTLNADLAKAENFLENAWGGALKAQGFTVPITYNTGNTARYTVARMLEDVIENYVCTAANGWGGVTVDIQPIGVAWSNYIVDMFTGRLPCFQLGWLADFPDPHNWFMPWMHSQGDFSGAAQHIEYGLGDISVDWPMDVNYPAPPYINALGEYVDAINNTYVDHLIATAVGKVPATREAIYNELMAIYYAEAVSGNLYSAIGRHYERTWLNGWIGGWNNNPICPGQYFYDMWKGTAQTMYPVDISATGTITNTTIVYPIIEVVNGEMTLDGAPAMINYTLHVSRLDYGPPPSVVVYIGFLRNETSRAEWYFPLDYTIVLGPNDDSAGGDDEFTIEITWYEEYTMEEGNWTIGLYASPVGTAMAEVYDTNLNNNIAWSPYIVEAIEVIHDVAVTAVTICRYDVLPNLVVGQGYIAQVNVTVENQGVFTEDIFVALRGNTTTIDTQMITLASGHSGILVFDWNTTGFAYGNYTVSGLAALWFTIPEWDKDDNTLADGWIFVTIPGDINADKTVDIFDAVTFSNAFDNPPGDPGWNPNADINGDLTIDIFDAIILANHFDETWV